MTQNRTASTLAALAALLLLPAAGAAADGHEVEKVEKKVKVQKRVACEGDDCDHTMVFVGDDGEMKVLAGDGVEWVGDDGERRVIKVMGHGGGKGGFLGVGMTELTAELRAHFGVPEEAGVMVSKVVDDSPAQRAGLRAGDIITLVNGETVGSGRALASMIGGLDDGATATLEVWRDGRVEQLTATIEERERAGLHGRMPHLHGHHGGRAMMLGGGGENAMKVIEIECDDDGGDCGAHGDHGSYDCGADSCEVEVRCTPDGCDCTVNGEAVDCSEIPGVPDH